MEHYIAGYGGHAKVIYQITQEYDFKINGFLNIPLTKKINPPSNILGIPVINFKLAKKNSSIYIGIGDNNDRSITFDLLKKKFKLPYLISKKSILHPSVKVGLATVIFPNSVINLDAKIGKNSIINTGAIIEHEVSIKDNVSISPGAIVCGKSIIGKNSFIGAGTIVQQNIKIGNNCVIGSGSNVINNVSNNKLLFGNPAKIR